MALVTRPQVSLKLGASKVQAAVHSTVLSATQVIVGAVVSTTVTFWLHRALLPQASVASQVRVASKVLPQWPAVLVTVLTMALVAKPQVWLKVGASSVEAAVHSTVLLATQVMVGAVVSTTVTTWLQVLLLPQESVALQVRVALNVLPQKPLVLVTVDTIMIVTFVPSALSLAVGGSKFQATPHSTVLSRAQVRFGGVASTVKVPQLVTVLHSPVTSTQYLALSAPVT